MCRIIILIVLLNFFNISLYPLITIGHEVRFANFIIRAKNCFFWFFDVWFWCCTLFSMIASFVISGSRPYSLFVFNDKILHAARLKLSIRGQELPYCCSWTICIKMNSFDIFTKPKLLIKAKLVIKQFVINSSQFCFFVGTSIFPSIYLCFQFFYTIFCLEHKQPQALTELAIRLGLRDISPGLIIILIFKGRAIHQFLPYSLCWDWLSSEHFFIRLRFSWRSIKFFFILLIESFNFLQLWWSSIDKRNGKLKIINWWLLLLLQIVVLVSWCRLVLTEIEGVWSCHKLFPIYLKINYRPPMRMTVSILQFNIPLFMNIRCPQW